MNESRNVVTTNQAANLPEFRKPSAIEALFNSALGFLVRLGVGPRYMRLLQVRGRKTGKIYSTPVNLIEMGGKPFLVAPRGRTHEEEKLEVLRLYLDRYKSQVQSY